HWDPRSPNLCSHGFQFCQVPGTSLSRIPHSARTGLSFSKRSKYIYWLYSNPAITIDGSGRWPIKGDIHEEIEKSNHSALGRIRGGPYRHRTPFSANGPYHVDTESHR